MSLPPMENLSMQEPQPSGGLNQTQAPPPAQPQGLSHLPQMFTTAAQLLDLTDKKLVLVLRDGRKMIGVLRSWDQFANLVLQDAFERIFVNDLYADIPRGIFLVRGENVLLLGEIDLDKDDYIPPSYKKASAEEVHALYKQQVAERKHTDKVKMQTLALQGFEAEHAGEVLF